MGPADWGFVVGVWPGAARSALGRRLGTGFLVSRRHAIVVVEPEGHGEVRLSLFSRSIDGTGRVVHWDGSAGLMLAVLELDAPVREDIPIPALGGPPVPDSRWETYIARLQPSAGAPVGGSVIDAELVLRPDEPASPDPGAPVVVDGLVVGIVSGALDDRTWQAVPSATVSAILAAVMGADPEALTEGARRVLAYAVSLLDQRPDELDVSPEDVLLGGLVLARVERRRGSTDALYASLGEERSARLDAAAAALGARLPDRLLPPLDVAPHRAGAIVARAAEYERRTTNAGTVGTRHLMAAALTAARDRAVLAALGRSQEELLDAMRSYVKARRPAESGWDEVLGAGPPRQLSGPAQDVCRLARQSGGATGADALRAGLLRHAALTERPDFAHVLAEAMGAEVPPGDVSELPALEPVHDGDFDGLIGRAYRAMTRTSGGGVVANRHLVAALVTSDGADLAGLDRDRFRTTFLDAVRRFCPDDNVRAWREELFGAAGAGQPSARPGYRPDSVTDEDQLGIVDDVNMLCDLLASEDTKPPLAVGLFGDWGTGKSFFMGQMERRINELTAAARAAKEAGGATAYCTHVVQIRFNAWSYLDTNLWANLAVGIFERLASPSLDPQVDPDAAWDQAEQERIAGERATLLSRLQTFQELRADVLRERQAAEDQKAAVAKQLEAVSDERRSRASDLSEVRARDVYAVLLKDPKLAELRGEAADAVGLTEVNVKDLRALSAQLSKVGGQAGAVWRLLLKDEKVGRRVFVAAVLCAGLALAGWAALFLSGPARAAGPLSILASLVGTVVTFARWVRPLLEKASGGLDVLTQALRRADDVEAAFEERRRKEEAALEDRLRELGVQEAVLVQKDADIAGRVAETERALVDLQRGRRLYRFIEERSASTEYREHLGIVALIRRDFDRLTRLLRFDNPDKGDLPPIDRIIVYVDDLDRCPPKRVVEVLQAVHLLLAYPIFVAVVGVDSRWLLRSLGAHIATMLAGEGGDAGEDAEWIGSPQNYLEKIFQIPFALAPMGPDGFTRLVQTAAGTVLPERRPVVVPEAAPAPAEASAPGDPTQPAPEAPARPAPAAGGLTGQAPPATDAIARSGLDANPPALRISEAEVEFMSRLAGACRTPRAAKSLVNLYRLVRASPGLSLAGYVEDREYEPVLVLLAVLVGFPRQAPALFRALPEAAGPWSSFVRGLKPEKRPDGRLGNTLVEDLAGADAEEWGRLQNWLVDMTADGGRDDVRFYAPWVPALARFSFETANGHPAPT